MNTTYTLETWVAGKADVGRVRLRPNIVYDSMPEALDALRPLAEDMRKDYAAKHRRATVSVQNEGDKLNLVVDGVVRRVFCAVAHLPFTSGDEELDEWARKVISRRPRPFTGP